MDFGGYTGCRKRTEGDGYEWVQKGLRLGNEWTGRRLRCRRQAAGVVRGQLLFGFLIRFASATLVLGETAFSSHLRLIAWLHNL